MCFLKPGFLFLCILPVLGGCGIFAGQEEEVRLEGERISIMELQTKLVPQEDLSLLKPFEPPEAWENDMWPQQGGYPTHAMHNPMLNRESLKKAWSTSIGRGSTKDLPLVTMPIVADGKVFAMNTKAELIALDAQKGRQLWKSEIGRKDEDDEVINGGIAYYNGYIYITNGYNEVLKVSSEGGDVLWRRTLPSPARAAPTVLGEQIFVQTLSNRLLALSVLNGDLLWSHQAIGESSALLGAPAPAANRDIIVPAYSSGELYALRIENGGVAWQDNLAPEQRLGGMESLSDIQALPVLDRGVVVAISYGGRLAVIDQRTGRRIWQREIGGAETPWVAGDSIFVLSSQNRLVSFDRESGNIRWVRDFPKFTEEDEKDKFPLVLYGPVMGGGRLFVTSGSGHIYEVDPADGDILRQWEADDRIAGPPVIARGTLYLLGESGLVSAYR